MRSHFQRFTYSALTLTLQSPISGSWHCCHSNKSSLFQLANSGIRLQSMKDHRGIFGEYTGLCGMWTSVISTSDCQADLIRQEEMGSVSMSDRKGTFKKRASCVLLGQTPGCRVAPSPSVVHTWSPQGSWPQRRSHGGTLSHHTQGSGGV